MTASTVMSLVTAALYGDNGKLDPVDLQNASLSGGVVVGAVANLMIQPYGAIICGTIVGVISTLGFEVVQVGGHRKARLQVTGGGRWQNG